MPNRLTKSLIDDTAPGPRDIVIRDTEVKGFAFKRTPAGKGVYLFIYRMGGRGSRLQKYTIGEHGKPWTVERARDEAAELRRMVRGDTRSGRAPVDPATIKAAVRAAAAEQSAAGDPDNPPAILRSQLEWVAAEFLARYARRRNDSWRETDRLFAKHVLPAWSGRQITAIPRSDVHALLDGMVDAGTPVLANRTLAAVRKLFNWAIDREIGTPEPLIVNPAARMGRPGAEVRRERELSDNEIATMWPALDTLGYPFGSVLKVCLLTAQRRNEVARMRWQDLDLEGERIWQLTSASTKAERAHIVPLAPAVIEILSALPRLGDFVFTTLGDRPVSGLSKAKVRADLLIAAHAEEHGRAKLAPWTIHDLRRTTTTGLSRLGVDPHIKSRVLNHAPKDVTERHYDRYQYLAEKRRALELWAAHVGRVTSPRPENVVRLAARA